MNQFRRVINYTFVLFLIHSFLVANLANAFSIVIDPGHGGSDPGAVNNSLNLLEKNLNFSLSNRIKNKLLPFVDNIIMTREGDTYKSMQERVSLANSTNANLFLSIHHDASTNTSANGISTHYSTYRAGLDTSDNYVIYNGVKYPFVKEEVIGGITYIFYNDSGTIKKVDINSDITVYDPTPCAAAQRSGAIAVNLASNLSDLGFNKAYTATGAKDQNFYVNRWTNMDSVLIENGFISNYTEAKKISDPVMEDKMAQKIADTIINYYNLNPIQITSISLDKSSPQVTGTTIQIVANATGGTERLYQFWVYDGKTWKVLRDYTTSNIYNWTPSASGEYKISVHVKDANSSKAYDDYLGINYSIEANPAKMSSVTTSLSSPQITGTNIKIVANATGGTERLYQFWIYDGKTWRVVRDYTTSNVYYWTPSAPGVYKISVHVKDKYSSESYDDYLGINYSIASPK